MNEENYTCEICCENYDLNSDLKLPKKVPCCNKTFCLSCLNDIYKRNNQTLKCPNCRKITYTLPKNLKDNVLIFSRFLTCCNCHETVPQNELYFFKNKNELQIKCRKCENGDMKLSDILPEFIAEIKNNLKDYEKRVNNDVIEIIKKKVKKEIEEYINDIKNKIIEIIVVKVIEEFNIISQIEKRENEFKHMINELNKNNKYLEDFVEDVPTKNFDSKQVLNCMKYYNDNISKIKYEFKFLGKFGDLIKKNKLIEMNQNFYVKNFAKCFDILVNKNKANKNEENKNEELNKNNDNTNCVNDKNDYNLLPTDENFIINDKILLELDKLIIKPKFEYNLSVNAQRV